MTREASQLKMTSNWNIIMRSVMNSPKLQMKTLTIQKETQRPKKSRFLLLTKIFLTRKYLRPQRIKLNVLFF